MGIDATLNTPADRAANMLSDIRAVTHDSTPMLGIWAMNSVKANLSSEFELGAAEDTERPDKQEYDKQRVTYYIPKPSRDVLRA